MTALEIILIFIGLILFAGSFYITEKITATKEQLQAAIDVNEVKKILKSQVEYMEDEIKESINTALEEAEETTKRSMEKLSNEKIMAINEYSDTVLETINKNHNEVMFLYDMLNDKNKEIRETADLIKKANKGINKKVAEADSVIGRLDSRIEEMNKLTDTQNQFVEKLDKSIHTIEVLEKQLDNIEEMAVQFSKDIVEAEEERKRIEEETRLLREQEKNILMQEIKNKANANAAQDKAQADTVKAEDGFDYTMLTAGTEETKEYSSENLLTETVPEEEGLEQNALTETLSEDEFGAFEETTDNFDNDVFAKSFERPETEDIKEIQDISPEADKSSEESSFFDSFFSESEEKADTIQEPENRNDRILNMYNSGKTVLEIAKALSLGIGEVQLVIDLFKGDKR